MIQAIHSLKRPNIAFILCLSLFGLVACDNKIDDFIDDLGDDDEESVVCEDVSLSDFKKIAYWSVSDDETLDDIDFTMLTHIIYNKIGVDSNGNLSLPTGNNLDEFEEMIETAQNNCVVTMVSIGNDSDTAFNVIAADKTTLDDFRENLEDLIDDYDLDGIDINWQFPEGDVEGDLFEDLMKEMDDLANDESILLSYVVDTGQDDDATDNGVKDDVLINYGDFLNIIALDTTDDDDLHSSLDDAKDAIEYWNARGVDESRLVLAIPVYSQGDGKLSFADIADDDLDNTCVDEAINVQDSDGKSYDDINYNGIPTVIEKTEYAQSYAGGVILTSLEQDYLSFSNYSLLLAVDWQVAGITNNICD
tara:strand:- start:3898 stop:4986 length:1089 start_codon:yes stop_codon:yes gene_type:complete